MAISTHWRWTMRETSTQGAISPLFVMWNILYAGGLFSRTCQNAECSDGTQAVGIAGWSTDANNGAGDWVGLAYGLVQYNVVFAITLDSYHHVLVGGYITGYCLDLNCTTSMPARHIAEFNPYEFSWIALGLGLNDNVYA